RLIEIELDVTLEQCGEFRVLDDRVPLAVVLAQRPNEPGVLASGIDIGLVGVLPVTAREPHLFAIPRGYLDVISARDELARSHGGPHVLELVPDSLLHVLDRFVCASSGGVFLRYHLQLASGGSHRSRDRVADVIWIPLIHRRREMAVNAREERLEIREARVGT